VIFSLSAGFGRSSLTLFVIGSIRIPSTWMVHGCRQKIVKSASPKKMRAHGGSRRNLRLASDRRAQEIS
jgi:hypothetical protein